MPLTSKQIERLLTPVLPRRVEEVRGNSYIPQFEVRAELNRVFGFGNWDSDIHDVTCIYETEEEGNDGKNRWKVCYRAACTLVIRDFHGSPVAQYTEWHAEESAPQPSRGEAHALALTSVESYALRRAAINLGDTFGLHLYKKGSLAPLIKGTLQTTDEDSPMFDAEAAEKLKPVLTPDQQAALANSLGATVIDETTGEIQTPDESAEAAQEPSGTYAGQ